MTGVGGTTNADITAPQVGCGGMTGATDTVAADMVGDGGTTDADTAVNELAAERLERSLTLGQRLIENKLATERCELACERLERLITLEQRLVENELRRIELVEHELAGKRWTRPVPLE